MNKYITYLIIGILIGMGLRVVWAKVLNEQAPYANQTIEEINYQEQTYNQWGLVEYVTENPDGSRKGRRGEMLILYTGGQYYLEICVSSPSGTVWVGKQLENSP